MPYQPTASQRGAVLGDIFYEVEQLAHTAAITTSEVVFTNAVVESRLLHSRSLLDFFERQECEKDDVLSVHYGFPARPVPVDPTLRNRLNKDLAHLTYSRAFRTAETRGWPSEGMVLPVLLRSQEFIDHMLDDPTALGTERFSQWGVLKGIVAKAIDHLSGA